MRVVATIGIDKPSLDHVPDAVATGARTTRSVFMPDEGVVEAVSTSATTWPPELLPRPRRDPSGRLDDARARVCGGHDRSVPQSRAHHRWCGHMRVSVDRVETIVVRLPERADFRWLSLSRPLGEFVLTRISGDGVEGWGEVVGLRDWGDADGRRHGETPATICSIVHEYLAPQLFERPFLLGELSGRLDQVVVGNPYAKALVDIAVHDLVGNALGVPAYDLLGGRTRESVPVAHMLGLMPDEDAFAEGRAAIADGVCALQVKGGQDVDRDVRVIAGLRQALGDDVVLRLDANGGYVGAPERCTLLLPWRRPAPISSSSRSSVSQISKSLILNRRYR